MENECEALPGVAYPGVRDNRSTINAKTGCDDDDDQFLSQFCFHHQVSLSYCSAVFLWLAVCSLLLVAVFTIVFNIYIVLVCTHCHLGVC